MKTLRKFNCPSAEVKLEMAETKDNVNYLYIVSEKPKRKNAEWHKSEYTYWRNKEAKEKFIELTIFWCR